jgi:small multidrug resistance pump
MGMAMAVLLVAIGIEVGATAALPRAQGFHDPFWTTVVLLGYATSIWLLAIVVRQIPVSVAYAIWAGLGTAAIAVVGVLLLGESWDLTKVAALGLIIVGVVVLNLHGAHPH